jgi:hypothetical protein
MFQALTPYLVGPIVSFSMEIKQHVLLACFTSPKVLLRLNTAKEDILNKLTALSSGLLCYNSTVYFQILSQASFVLVLEIISCVVDQKRILGI